jgi:hypothetical protein
VVIAAGMVVGTLFTLFVTPAVYTFIAKDYQKLKARDAWREPGAAGEAPVLAETMARHEVELSPEGQAISSAADATASGQSKRERRLAGRPSRRRRFSPAAE